MKHTVLNKHKAKSIIQIYSDVMKTQSHCGDEEDGRIAHYIYVCVCVCVCACVCVYS